MLKANGLSTCTSSYFVTLSQIGTVLVPVAMVSISQPRS